MTDNQDISTPFWENKSRTRCAVIIPELRGDSLHRDAQYRLAEACGLADAIWLDVIFSECLSLSHPTPSTLFGKGQVEILGSRIKDNQIELVIVDHALSPVQQRNLEREWQCKVIDRTGLILEIFGERARTREGKLQVELASLTYQRSRLVRSWTHLERQRGGFGFLGGPGESQIELDRRMIIQRIIHIKKDLLEVRRTRGLQRKHRQRTERPTIALVGYTNAGKSTLFNSITGAEVMAANLLFATLDPTMRSMKLPSGRDIVVSDTVGFISDLPTQLIEAFRATLEEVTEADVILHVRDAAHPETKLQRDSVLSILSDLDIKDDDPRLIEVLNKADLLPEEERTQLQAFSVRMTEEGRAVGETLAGLRREARGGTVALSALTGEGMNTLMDLIERLLATGETVVTINLNLDDGAAFSWLHQHGSVLGQKNTAKHIKLKVRLDSANLGRFQQKFPDYATTRAKV